MQNLDQLREKIDGIDDKLLSLFEERMAVVSEIAAHKKTANIPVTDLQRETEKLKVIAAKTKPETENFARILYNTLFDLSRSYQRNALRGGKSEMFTEIETALKNTPNLFPEKASVACQGVIGAYSEQAATRLFKQPDIQYFRTYDAVFSAIQSGFCTYGVLPLENSTAGSVNKVYNLMQDRDFRIVRSIRMKIDHNLLVPKGVKREEIREIVSHEQALAQCAGFIEKLGDIKTTQCENTAAAAEMIATGGRRDIAAISSYRCTKLYDLDCLERDIQDRRDSNYTRFICISNKPESFFYRLY